MLGNLPSPSIGLSLECYPIACGIHCRRIARPLFDSAKDRNKSTRRHRLSIMIRVMTIKRYEMNIDDSGLSYSADMTLVC